MQVRIKQARGLATRSLSHPSWVLENVRLFRHRWREVRTPFPLANYERHVVGLFEAVQALLGTTPEQFRAAAATVWTPTFQTGEVPENWNASDEFMLVLGILVELLQPDVVVELGVARGFSSAVMLAALQRNRRGTLHSVDLPVLAVDADGFVGQAIPDNLRDRWTLTLGPSRQVLPALLRRVAPLDLFVHDGDHTYASQIEEYRRCWPFLRPGGVLVSDDVRNPAFLEFAFSVQQRPYLVLQSHKPFPLGLLRKPGGSTGITGQLGATM